MTNDEIRELNNKRLMIQLDPIIKQFKKNLIPYYKTLVFYDVNDLNKQISLDDIDFNSSCVFISSKDILSYVSLFALQKISGVRPNDITKSGKYSRITKRYLISESNEMRYAGKASFDIKEQDDISDIYKPELFYNMPLVIWRLGDTVASKYNEYMYEYCCERVHERNLRGLTDWCFFIGSLDELRKSYSMLNESIPVYVAVPNNITVDTTTSTNLF